MKYQNQIDLHDEFISALFLKEPKRAELVKLVSSVLKIEKEPASRRLNKTVLFSIREMGILSSELDLSIDSMLYKDHSYRMTPILLGEPLAAKSMDHMADMLESHINDGIQIASTDSELGMILDSLPIEFLISYPQLLKFALFSWGHYYIPSDEFEHYGAWEVPQRFTELLKKYTDYIYGNTGRLIYVWNDTLIWNLIRKVNYLYSMYVIKEDEKEIICTNIHEMLTELESMLRDQSDDPRLILYIAKANIGMTVWYHISETCSSALMTTSFFSTAPIKNREHCDVIKNWVYSMKNLSTLISGSGQKERRLFFEEQHQMVDSVSPEGARRY